MKAIQWLKKLFNRRCPECRSKDTYTVAYISYSMNMIPTHTQYECKDCGNCWVHNEPK